MARHINDSHQVSRYTPLWESLKKEGKLSLLVFPPLKNRIIKAVRKKRDTDLAFRFELAESKMQAVIHWTYKNNVLTATLEYSKPLTLDQL